jgi:hypothetical protein
MNYSKLSKQYINEVALLASQYKQGTLTMAQYVKLVKQAMKREANN